MNTKTVRIEDVCDFVGGSQPPKSVFTSTPKENYIRLVQTRDYKTDNFLTFIPIKDAKRFCTKDDIMIGRYGPPIFQILRGLEGAYNVALMKAVPKSNTLNDYLYYFLKQESVFNFVEGLSLRTGGQTGVDLDSLNKYPILLPDLEYQKIVVDVLKSLDTKIQINNQIITKLEKMAKLLYEYWFVQSDFPDANGKPYKSSGGKMVWSDELKRDIPEGWEIKSLGQILHIVRGASPRPIDSYLSDKGTPWVKISDATSTENRFILETKQFIREEGVSNSRQVSPNTLILSNSATPAIPRIIKINACVHDGWLVIDGYTKGLTLEFIYQFFFNERPRIIYLGNGSIFKNLKTDYIKSLKIALPPEELLDSFNPLLKSISESIYIKTRENQQLSALRDWLLPMLMNGQVKVSTDKNNELAHTLNDTQKEALSL